MVSMEIMKNRAEWLQKRTSYIGGSDAAAVIGRDPWMSNTELWEIKTGRSQQADISDKPYVKYGIAAEDHIRELYKLDHPEKFVEYVPNNIWLNDEKPFGHASLDGWITDENDRFGVLEIKTSEVMSKAAAEKWRGRIPDTYYIQLLHYFAITEAKFADPRLPHRARGSRKRHRISDHSGEGIRRKHQGGQMSGFNNQHLGGGKNGNESHY